MKERIGKKIAEEKDVGGVSGKKLKSFIERIERLEEEKSGIADDIKEVYAEAKSMGFDTKTIRYLIKIRKQDTDKRREAESIANLYRAAIGMEMFDETPLGSYANNAENTVQ